MAGGSVSRSEAAGSASFGASENKPDGHSLFKEALRHFAFLEPKRFPRNNFPSPKRFAISRLLNGDFYPDPEGSASLLGLWLY